MKERRPRQEEEKERVFIATREPTLHVDVQDISNNDYNRRMNEDVKRK